MLTCPQTNPRAGRQLQDGWACKHNCIAYLRSVCSAAFRAGRAGTSAACQLSRWAQIKHPPPECSHTCGLVLTEEAVLKFAGARNSKCTQEGEGQDRRTGDSATQAGVLGSTVQRESTECSARRLPPAHAARSAAAAASCCSASMPAAAAGSCVAALPLPWGASHCSRFLPV